MVMGWIVLGASSLKTMWMLSDHKVWECFLNTDNLVLSKLNCETNTASIYGSVLRVNVVTTHFRCMSTLASTRTRTQARVGVLGWQRGHMWSFWKISLFSWTKQHVHSFLLHSNPYGEVVDNCHLVLKERLHPNWASNVKDICSYNWTKHKTAFQNRQCQPNKKSYIHGVWGFYMFLWLAW